MSLFADVQQFVRDCNRVTAIPELENLLEGATRTFGFDYYALGHHVSRAQAGPNTIRIVDYPDLWTDMIIARGYYTDDPVMAASERSAAAFDWFDLPDIIELTERHVEIIEAAHDVGIGNGFVIPVHIPGEYPGSCTFTVRTGRSLPVANFPAAQYVGCFAFEAARRMSPAIAKFRPQGETSTSQTLTQRQSDCLLLVAKGKSDWDIGRLLGISDQTVHKHIEESKRRYGVPTRMQLVIRALFNGQLTFSDVLN